ncbi:MAG: hypothetical protein H7Z37_17535 [Pyrinomonadaceae bacterium]|nr:hypothetical protein [Pyrinomonadaceae bacterium]
MATYEGKWRCLRCSSVNLGRDLHCVSCGVKRDENVEFFLEDDAQAVDNKQLLEQANAGANWVCQYCGGNNSALDARCTSCGNTKSDSDKVLTEETRGVNDWSEEAQKAHRENQRAQTQQTQQNTKRKSFLSSPLAKLGLIGCGVLIPILIVIFAALLLLSTWQYPAELEVTGLEWQRSIAVEEYKTVAETAWEGEMPRNARVTSSEKAIYSYNKVPTGSRPVTETYSDRVSDGTERYVCGKKNKKNGYFEDVYCTRTKYKTVTKTRTRQETTYTQVPVFRNRYNYTVDKWVNAGDKTTSGNDFNPSWANFTTSNSLREAGRKENYTLILRELTGSQTVYKQKLTPETWSRFQNGMRLQGKKNFFGSLVSVEQLPNADW